MNHLLYVESAAYSHDLEAVRGVWSQPGSLGAAGAFIFLTYLTLPILVAVRSRSGASARSFLDGERERLFLCGIIGLDGSAGIRNAAIRQEAAELGVWHRGFAGMKGEYLDLMGAVIALAPLRLRGSGNCGGVERVAYWRYMRYTMGLIGADFDSETEAEAACSAFVDAHSGSSPEGVRLFAELRGRHPGHVSAAQPALFDGSRRALKAMRPEGGLAWPI